MAVELLSLAEAAKEFSRPVHINTVRRWIDKGALVAGGRRVPLKAKRIGWRLFTTREWISDFERKCDTGTEPVVTERQGTPAEVLMRLKARGLDGPEEKRKVLGLSKRSRSSGAMPRVLSVGPLRNQNEADHGARVG